ncbi:MAG: L-seryl-tRNA(Sec) selenium transferase [Chloroflexota bacterium]
MKDELRNLPGVDRLLADPRLSEAATSLSRETLADLARQTLAELRQDIRAGAACPPFEQIAETVRQRAGAVGRTLRSVINATGVVLHTNLGRAPMSEATIEAMEAASRGYVNLELELDTGKRGSRQVHVESLLCRLSGAEAALVVNNNAAAVLLGLSALARGREVIVSRGQAVQIGGGFRIPDIMRRSGARLVEVGTTNFTEAADYAEAITPKTAALLRVHSSNFKIVGFTEGVGLAELVALGAQHGLHVLDDLGSGCFLDTSRFGLSREPMVQDSVSAGAGLTFFSGDKLLGGPQAGLIVGRKELVDKLKRHPLARAVRIDKTRLAGLVATLLHYLRGEAESEIPVWQMLSAPLGELEARARRWAAAIGPVVEVERGESLIGGGSLPGSTLPTWLLAIREPSKGREKRMLPELARRLRSGATAIVCRIEKDRMLLDPRTVMPGEEETLLAALGRGIHAAIRGAIDMEEGAVTAEGLAREHQQIARDTRRLATIATELDELGHAHTVAEWASRAAERPLLLLSQLERLLTSFEHGLKEHFAKEERYMPELARRYKAEELVASLRSEHKEALSVVGELRDKVRDLSRSEVDIPEKQASLREITESLRAILVKIEAHAEKEDEVLFIIDHNV